VIGHWRLLTRFGTHRQPRLTGFSPIGRAFLLLVRNAHTHFTQVATAAGGVVCHTDGKFACTGVLYRTKVDMVVATTCQRTFGAIRQSTFSGVVEIESGAFTFPTGQVAVAIDESIAAFITGGHFFGERCPTRAVITVAGTVILRMEGIAKPRRLLLVIGLGVFTVVRKIRTRYNQHRRVAWNEKGREGGRRRRKRRRNTSTMGDECLPWEEERKEECTQKGEESYRWPHRSIDSNWVCWHWNWMSSRVVFYWGNSNQGDICPMSSLFQIFPEGTRYIELNRDRDKRGEKAVLVPQMHKTVSALHS
jgi:hypothetical protein